MRNRVLAGQRSGQVNFIFFSIKMIKDAIHTQPVRRLSILSLALFIDSTFRT